MDPLTLIRNTPFSQYTSLVTRLTGGQVNYVWRLANKHGQTIIVKYADTTLSEYPEMKFSVERMDFEARALALFNPLQPEVLEKSPLLKAANELIKDLKPTPGIRVPKLLYHDHAVPFMVLEDIGDHKNYETWCVSNPPTLAADDVYMCGLIGEWIARLHGFGKLHFDVLKPMFTNTPARDLIGEAVYKNAQERIEKYTDFEDKQEMADCIAAFDSEIAAKAKDANDDDRTLVFGDLWSGSLLFDQETRVVNVLDLEFADISLVFGDVGHFVAHLLPVYFICNKDYDPNTDPCPPNVEAFLLAYKRVLLAEYPDLYKAVIGDAVRHATVHFGAEVARDVLMGNWCRCGSGKTENDAPLTCKCADTLLRFTRPYIKNTSSTLFSLLLE
ncbi:hypothetical protein GQ54DRAFT_309650 [Martensiomyces pterosporus]|nr:hypothetical protein GQ54DRAFT_309650 [Martensiomyces pterosporus]